jgi:cellulose synthase/poly-beta-1,6-N-acetylglucosamine synthase-like glycosyltransferase
MRLAQDMIDDFVIATEIHLQGLRTIYEPEAISVEDTNHRSRDEFRMRVRVMEQTMSALSRYRRVLNPLRHGLFAWQMISHKVLRYMVPICLLIAFLTNYFLMKTAAFFALAFYGQAMIYATALGGYLAERLQFKIGPLAIPYYFVLANIALLVAFLKFARGEAHVVWEPIREQEPVR